MVTTQDASVGLALESIYGTGVTVTRFPEFIMESLDWKKTPKQSQALRVGNRLALQRGRVIPKAEAAGDLEFEAASKGHGLIWNLLMGAGASTLVSAGTYQQVFTFADTLPSATVQKVVPDANGGFNPFTFLGVMCESFDISFANADVVKVKAVLNAKDLTTATAAATPSYIASPVNLFQFANAALYSGTLTEPTTTALGSAPTQLGNVRGGNISVKHSLQMDRYNVGGGGRKAKPLVTTRDVSAKLDVEFDSMTMSNALLAETPMSLVANWTAGSLSTGLETLQVIIPCLMPESELPKTNADKLILQNMQFTGLNNLVASQPMWIILRTSDAAL